MQIPIRLPRDGSPAVEQEEPISGMAAGPRTG